MRATRTASLLLGLALLGCEPAGPAQGGGGAPAAARPVRVARAEQVPWPRSAHVVGGLEPHERATLATKVQGRLEALRVDVGSRVAAGEEVARLERVDLALEAARAESALAESRASLGLETSGDAGVAGAPAGQLRAEEAALVKLARAQLDEARANHQRAVVLRERGIATQAELDAADAAFRAAQSRLEDALQEWERRVAALGVRQAELALTRQRLADAVVLAPFAGVILERHAAPGDVLAAGSPLATLVSTDPLRLRAEVPEREAALVRPGQLVRLSVEGHAAPFEVRLARLSPELSAETRMLRVEADVPNPEGVLRAGTFCRVEVVIDPEARTLAIPPAALRSFAGLDKVLLVREGKAVEQTVLLGRREPGRVEVLSGLQAGQEVVLEPGSLAAGAPVTVEPQGPPAGGGQPEPPR